MSPARYAVNVPDAGAIDNVIDTVLNVCDYHNLEGKVRGGRRRIGI